MSCDLKPFCPVNARFLEDLKLSGRKPRTQQAYVRAVRKFTKFLGHPPVQATVDQLLQYLLFSSIPKSGQAALQLQIADIDSKRWLVHIHRGKGAKDRLVPLPHSTYLELRSYWATHRNPVWIFPAEGRNHKLAPTAEQSMSESSVHNCAIGRSSTRQDYH